MRLKDLTPTDIRNRGIEALAKKLGPVGMVRFLLQFDRGRGDYTEERRQWLAAITLEDIAQHILRYRRRKRKSVKGVMRKGVKRNA